MGIFNTKKQENSILDCFTYDLTTFFYDDYKEVDSEETPATFMIVYEKDLPWKEMSIFDTVQFRIFFDKDVITGSNPVNVKFINKQKQGDINDLKSIVNRIVNIYKTDDQGKNEWNDSDTDLMKKGTFRRVWTIENGESFISVEYNQTDGISLNILFFNNIIKQQQPEPL